MEFEQLVKRLEWLDEEHRKTRTSIITLEEKMAALEGSIDVVSKQLKPLGRQISEISSATARLDQFDAIFAKQREDMNKAIDAMDKRFDKRDKDLAKRHQQDIESLGKAVETLKKTSDMAEIKRELKARAMEESRLNQAITDLRAPVDEAIRAAEEAVLSQRAFEEGRKQDAKRFADLQGDLTAVRKRIDEARARADLSADSVKTLDSRINEIMLSESERRTAQAQFIESQTVAQVDRERTYKDWQETLESFKRKADTLDSQISTLEETLRNAKRAQETYNELNTKLERRINEVTEMQRLAEDRLRQEWVTFKADDQKRWTGYTLSQDESSKDLRKIVEKLDERLGKLDESTQTMRDQMHQTADATEKQLQELMNVAHEWLSAYERIMGHGKAAKKSKK